MIIEMRKSGCYNLSKNINDSNNQEQLNNEQIDWHSGFAGSLSLCLYEYKDLINIVREHQLTKHPPRIDYIVIKKDTDTVIDNDIGRIFKKHNIIEYKNPKDALDIDVIWKCIGYTGLYKGLADNINAIPEEELTISIFRHNYPRKLIKELNDSGKEVENPYPGVYYIKKLICIPVQIVVTKELKGDVFLPLRIMAPGADADDVRKFITNSAEYNVPGLRINADAVFQVSASANKELYVELRKEAAMCQALREIMAPEIEESRQFGLEQGLERGLEQGLEQGKIITFIDLINDKTLTIEDAAERMSMSVEEFKKYIEKYKK